MFLLNIDIESSAIDSGSHGSIYKAKDNEGNTFAVKVINRNFNILEPAIMLGVKHPFINSSELTLLVDSKVMIFQDIYQNDLHEYLKHNTVPETIKTSWCDGLVSAIAFLHSLKIVHGDIKAKNVLIDDKLNIKLTDFSLSVIILGSDKVKQKVSTFTHAPLECLESRGWSFPLDIWCLGCTLFEIKHSTSLFPFQGKLEDFKSKASLIRLNNKHINCLKFWGGLSYEGPILEPVLPEGFPKDKYDQCIMSCLKVEQSERITIDELMKFLNLVKPKGSVLNRRPLRNKPSNLDILAGNMYSMLSVDILKDKREAVTNTLVNMSKVMQGQRVTVDEDIQELILTDLQFMLLNLTR